MVRKDTRKKEFHHYSYGHDRSEKQGARIPTEEYAIDMQTAATPNQQSKAYTTQASTDILHKRFNNLRKPQPIPGYEAGGDEMYRSIAV